MRQLAEPRSPASGACDPPEAGAAPGIDASPEAQLPGASPGAAAARPRARLFLRQIGVDLTGGLIAALIQVGVLIAKAALIFAGPLAPFISDGVGLLLVGTGVMSVVFALLSPRPGMLILAQDGPALMIALIAANAAGGAGPGATAYFTVLAAIALTTLATGLTFLLLGYFRLGALVRYLPYPVVGGFLAGTGWLRRTASGAPVLHCAANQSVARSVP